MFTDLAKNLRIVQPAHSYKIRVSSVIAVSTKNEGEYIVLYIFALVSRCI